MSFTFGNDGTRPIEAGDTPDIQDDYAVSIPVDAIDIIKGQPYQVLAGVVSVAATAAITYPRSPVVSTENKDNSGGSSGDLEARCITAGQMIALQNTTGADLTIQKYVGTSGSTAGELVAIGEGAANTTNRKYARYVGKEGAVFERSSSTPYIESLTVGIVPDQTLADDEVGWFQLVESAF